MKQVFHKIMSLIMAFVVLFSTMSFTVDMHYCGNTIVDFSFIHEVETCGMEKVVVATSCENPSMSESSCCSDEKIVIDGQNDLKDTFNKIDFQQQIFIVAYIYSYNNLFEGTAFEAPTFIDYAPPFVKQDAQVLFQTFLI